MGIFAMIKWVLPVEDVTPMQEELYARCVNPPSWSDWCRFWSKVDLSPGKGPKGSCWHWKAQLTEKGYGSFHLIFEGKRKQVKAHRILFSWMFGNLNKSQILDHIECDSPPCCNFNHIKVTDNRGNTQREGS